MPKLVLNCLINGDELTQHLTVAIDKGKTFANLKKAIIAEDPGRFVGVGPSQLTLYKVKIPIVDDGIHQYPSLRHKLFVGEISTVFSATPLVSDVHILVMPRKQDTHSTLKYAYLLTIEYIY